MNLTERAILAKADLNKLWQTSEEERNAVLIRLANLLIENKEQILAANQQDVKTAKTADYGAAFVDRLTLDEKRLQGLADAVLGIAKQPQVVFQFEEEHKRADGLIIKKQRIPIGLIGIIFESRPNVILDCFALGLKSANGMFLKGGKEAKETNQIFMDLAHEALGKSIPDTLFQLLLDKEAAQEMLQLKDQMDLIIPRGSEKLIQYVKDNSKVPVICHAQGLCHMYVDDSVDASEMIALVMNSKMQRTGVCNALETLLLDSKISLADKDQLFHKLDEAGCELRLDEKLSGQFPRYKKATTEDWRTEYLDAILSVKEVADVRAAISHIQFYGSHHTEAIVSKRPESIELFLNQVDASCIAINASTRFNDGGELGLGAEVGISTTKIHAYGPMGARDLTTTRYCVEGKGHVR
tara:strand:+ start:8841 stop:10073 length:1233 start_codon:yes stop_codon:yes gene_type:complete